MAVIVPLFIIAICQADPPLFGWRVSYSPADASNGRGTPVDGPSGWRSPVDGPAAAGGNGSVSRPSRNVSGLLTLMSRIWVFAKALVD